jgi:hypothetical protein
MTADFFKSFGAQIACHKAMTVGAVCIAITTALWAAGDLSHRHQGSSHWRGSEQAGGTNAAESTPTLKTADGRSTGSGATLDDALKFGRKSLAALKPVADYTAVFTKSELIDGKLLTQTMDIKCRKQPFSVYLGNHRRGGKGREVIYVAGANDGNILVHEAGLKSVIGTLHLKPDCPKVMETNRHPVTDVGLVRLIEMAMAMWEVDKREADPAQVDVRFFHDVKVGTANCQEVQITHHQQRPKIGYQIGRVYVDNQTGFPIQAEVYGWPEQSGEEAPLLEKYTYTDIKTNVGLTSRDFDPQNADYHFVSR